jgi:antitoxin CcdA
MGHATTAEGRRGQRRATNVTLSSGLILAAKQLGINVSEACEAGLRERVAEARRERWLAENREAIDAYNARIEREGPTLSAYRRF